MAKQQTQDLCQRIVRLDKSIRFAGVSDRFGKIVAEVYRKGSAPLLSKEEQALSILQAAIRMGTRKTMIPKLGKLSYTFSVYDKVKRATIPMSNQLVLMVSFDREASPESIILNEILPLAKEH